MASNVGLGVCLMVCTMVMIVMAVAFQWQNGSCLHEMELRIIEHERRVSLRFFHHDQLCNNIAQFLAF